MRPSTRLSRPRWSETEVFQPGSTGTAIGTTYDAGRDSGGDEIYIPDENGIDIVGQWSDFNWPPPGVGQPANAYQFESFTSPSTRIRNRSSSASRPTARTTPDLPANELLPGDWPAGVTEAR